MISYIVTTKSTELPADRRIAMVDGTVPGWSPRVGDLHYDHHRPGGALIQVDEMPSLADQPILQDNADAAIVTTQLDADACVAAAWLQLERSIAFESALKLKAIAYDCDHLGLPANPLWDEFRDFARNAVATLKLSGDAIATQMGLPADRRSWTDADRHRWASECFAQSTQHLISAAKGEKPFPGENGEAAAYWERIESQRSAIEARCSLVEGIAVLDARGVNNYIDPRLLVEWARKQTGHRNVTLTVSDRPVPVWKDAQGQVHAQDPSAQGGSDVCVKVADLPGYKYTLGSVPLHEGGSPKFSDRGVWKLLADVEYQKRSALHLPKPSTSWGGRNEVGGSGWNDGALLLPSEVLAIVNAANVESETPIVESARIDRLSLPRLVKVEYEGKPGEFILFQFDETQELELDPGDLVGMNAIAAEDLCRDRLVR